jgi:outer membrane protein, multidrug efflux system
MAPLPTPLSPVTVQQLTAQLADTRATEREVLQQAVEAENRINLLLGRFPQPIARDPSVLASDLPRTIHAGVPSELLANRPDIREAELQVKASQFGLKAARAAFFPSLTINAGVGLQAFNPAFLFRPESIAYSVLGGLVAPLVNWTALQAQFSSAKATQIQAMYNYQKTILVGFVEVANGLSNVRNTEELLALRRTQKSALDESVDAADALYRAGRATYLDVLLAQQSSLQADLDLIEASKRRRLTTVVVYKALGGGWR